MTNRLADIQQQLMGTFFEEAAEALTQIESGLLALEKCQDDPTRIQELVNDVFRAAHSIKGGAATFGLHLVAELAHSAETLLDRLRSGSMKPTTQVTAMLLASVDSLRALVSWSSAADGSAAPRIDELCRDLDAAARQLGGATREASAALKPSLEARPSRFQIHFQPKPEMLTTGNDAVRLLRELTMLGNTKLTVDISRLPSLREIELTKCYLAWQIELEGAVTRAQIDEVFSWVDTDADIKVEELVEAATATVGTTPTAQAAPSAERAHEPAARTPEPGSDREGGSIRVSVGKLDMLMNMVGELVITQSILGELEGDGPIDVKRLASLRDGLALLARNTRALQESVMSLRSMPIGTVFSRFPRLVHDLSRQLGKHVELKLSGQTVEVDKTVLEKLGDPLTHLVRNSLDHGIEKPELRSARGKPETGTLSIRAFHRGGDIVVELEDDGGGLDLSKILSRAKERGLVGPDENLSDEAIRELIFAPGFSTADTVSDVSGRGVGMDVVRRNIKAIGGQIQMTSVLGQGTRTTLRLPLTLAIIDGQLVGVGNYTYVVPLLSILESVEIHRGRVSQFEGKLPLYRLRDELVPIVRLANVLGVDSARSSRGPLESGLLVVVETEGERLGLLVDELQAQQQVVVKSLETNYGFVDGLAGATILGDGSIALILDVQGISRLARSGRTVLVGRAA